MLNSIIRFALNNRLLIVCVSLAVIVLGTLITASLPIDVLPDLTRPRVTVFTEAHGMAPEEVEQRVTFPLESALNGAPGVTTVRSTSDIGYSAITVEFDWGADIYTARQIVQERIAMARDRLPRNAETQLSPISSLLGQIAMIGMRSADGETSALELRTLADWVVAQRLRSIPGVSQVIVMGGGRKQFQVLVDPHRMHNYDVALVDIEQALLDSNLNVTGGYLPLNGKDFLVRGLGQIESIDNLEKIVVKPGHSRPILLAQVARITEAAQVKRGDAAVNGDPAVVITVAKQPGVDTRALTEKIDKALADIDSLPADIVIDANLYQQRGFIDQSVANVAEALRDGAILVVIVLFLFLLNFRTTFITLTAIPLSILTTAMVFWLLDMSINVMTLGGIAVALGELVDDAIVDVENIYRRLKQNARAETPRPVLRVIYEASLEVRGAIIISTILVIVVFSPLFALSGMEGRLFTPLGLAYIVAILASTVVSLTVTPVLSYFLLPKAKATRRDGDGPILWLLKRVATPFVRLSMNWIGFGSISMATTAAVAISVITVWNMGSNFLPPFDEGAMQVNLFAKPGTSLAASREFSHMADEQFAKLVRTDENPTAPLLNFVARTGRAEEDEHAMPVNVTEYVMALNPESELTREQTKEALHKAVEHIPGVESEVEQPIAHLISHMLSGVTAQIAIKLYGDDLTLLRAKAQEIKREIATVEGIAEPVVEQQQIIPQLRIELLPDQLAFYGLTARYVQDFVETAMNGHVISQVYQGQRSFDLLLRLDEPYRLDIDNLDRMPLELPRGGRIPLSAVARVYEAGGPNIIYRENARRRIVVRVNTTSSDLGTAVAEIERRIDANVNLPEGYFVEFGGQFEAQQTATQRILWFSLLAMAIVCVVLYSAYPSISIVLQILIALPAAFAGGVAALVLTDQSLSVAAMVGFISLGGIAARNGLLLVSTYLDLSKEEGFTRQMILHGSLERLAPVFMTALTTGLGLLPLVIGGNQPGKEILFPVATVILGGLVTSTLAEFLLRPGLFWMLSRRAAERLGDGSETEQL